MKNIILIINLLVISVCGYSQTKQNVLKSSVTFEIKNLGIKTNGKFEGLQADVMFKPDSLNASRIVASVEASTVNTDNSMRDNHLKKEDFFDVEHYPRITLKSITFKRKSAGSFIGVFDLTIKNKTRRIEFPFSYTETGNTAGFKGSFKINRLDFGVGGKSMTMADDVKITVDLQTSKQ